MQNASTWIKELHNQRQIHDRRVVKAWFENTFDWSRQSIWVGRIKSTILLPDDDQQIIELINRLLAEVEPYKSQIFINFHYLIQNKRRIIEYLMICESPEIFEQLNVCGVKLMFDYFQITKEMLEKDHLISKLFDDYLAYSGIFHNEVLKHEINNWDRI